MNGINRNTFQSAILYWSHVGILLLGICFGILAAHFFTSLQFDFSGEIETAKRLGIVSPTILSNYPKSKDVLTYISFLGFPIIFSVGIWLVWARGERRRGLSNLFYQVDELLPNKDAGWIVSLLIVIICYFLLSFDINYFYGPISGWGLLAEEGAHLAYAQTILSGGVYGKDFFSPYGPMMIYPMVWLMKLFGVTVIIERICTYLLNFIAYGICIFFLFWTLRSKTHFIIASIIYFLLYPLSTNIYVPTPHSSYLRVALGLSPLLFPYLYLQMDKKYLLLIAGALSGQSLLFSQEVGICSFFSQSVFILLHNLGKWSGKGCIRELSLLFAGCFVSVMPMLVYLHFKGAFFSSVMDLYEYPKYVTMGYSSLPFSDIKSFLAYPTQEGMTLEYWIIFVYLASATYLIPLILLGQRHKDLLLKASLLVFGILLFRSALGRSDGLHVHFVSPPAFLLVFLFADHAIKAIQTSNAIQFKLGSLLFPVILLTATFPLFTIPGAPLKTCTHLMMTEVVDFRQRWSFRVNGHRIPDLKRGGVMFDLATVQTMTKIHHFLQLHTKPGEYVYFFPNEAAYYFLFNRKNPTRYPASYQTVTRRHRYELVADLDRKKPRYVVYSLNTARVDGITENIQTPEVTEYLKKEYVLEADLEGVHILRRIRP